MSLEIKNKRLENEISKQKELIIQLKKSVDSNIRLSKELESSQKKLIEQEKTMELLGIRHDEFEKLLQLKNQNINELEEINELYKSQLNEFSNNLASEIAEKERMKRQFRIFRLNKCGNFGSLVLIPTLLILRKDINDRFILEIETNYSKITLAANAILELNLCKENPKKFSLTYKIEVKYVFFKKFTILER